MKEIIHEFAFAIAFTLVGAAIVVTLTICFIADHCERFDRNNLICQVKK